MSVSLVLVKTVTAWGTSPGRTGTEAVLGQGHTSGEGLPYLGFISVACPGGAAL